MSNQQSSRDDGSVESTGGDRSPLTGAVPAVDRRDLLALVGSTATAGVSGAALAPAATADEDGFGEGGYGTGGFGGVDDSVPHVVTRDPTEVTDSSAVLNGELVDLGEADAVESYFEWRATGADSWTATDRRTLRSAAEFDEGIADLDEAVDYEFRAVAATTDDTLRGSTRSFSPDDPAVVAEVSASPPPIAPGDEVTLDASGSTASDGTISSYEWDFVGDGSFADGESIETCIYDDCGRYDVAVRVTTDSGATATARVRVTVSEPAGTDPVGDAANPPRDVTGDGTCEDVTGTGEATVEDVEHLADNLDDPVVRNHPERFDFSGTGGAVSMLDVQALYDRVEGDR